MDRANAENFTIIWVGDLWERATFMRGMEKLLLDLALHPRFVEELLRGLADYILRTMEILFARFEFDGIALSDDYGTQQGMLMSPAHWRQFVKPRSRRSMVWQSGTAARSSIIAAGTSSRSSAT